MDNTRTGKSVNNIFFGCLNKLLGIIFPFIIRTIIINVLGIQYLGLNSLYTSILTILNLADLGFNTTIVYSMYKPIAQNDTQTVNALLKLYRKIYKVVGIIVLTAGLAVMPVLPYLIKGSYPSDINLYTLYLIFLANNVIGYFFFAYKTSVLTANQRSDVTSKVSIVINVFYYMAQVLALILAKNYYIYIIFMPISTLIRNVINAWAVKKMYPQYFCSGELNKEIKADIKKKITALVTHRIGYVVQNSIDSICISVFMGLVLLGKYNNYLYIITAVEGFITIFKQSVLAGVGNCAVTNDVEYNKKVFNKLLFILQWIVGWCSVCFLCLFQPFIKVWIGQENMLSFYVVISVVAMFYINQSRSAVGLYKDALGMWWEDRFKPICISLVNLVLTIICAYFGFFEGIILSTCVAYLFVGFPWETHVLFKHYFKQSPAKYYLKQLFYLIVSLIAMVASYFLCSLVPLEGKKLIAVNFVICLIVPNLIFFLAYFKTRAFKDAKHNVIMQKDKYMSKIKSLFRKIKNHMPRFIKNWEVRDSVDDYNYYLKHKNSILNMVDTTIKCKEEPSNYVFTCWLQGEENAPELVKACFKSMREQLKGKQLVVITSKNLKEYTDMPQYIYEKWEKGIISNTHFSDLLRLELLAKYGGLWIDSTVLCTGDLSRYVNKDTKLFVYKNDHRNNPAHCLSSWLIYAKANNPIIVNTRNILFKYWEKNKKLEKFFLVHIIFTAVKEKFKDMWEEIPFESNINPHIIWFNYFYETFNKDHYLLAKRMSNFHKLSNKYDKSKLKEDSFYDRLIKGKLDED